MGELVEVQLPSGRTMWATVEPAEQSRDVSFGDRFTDLPGLSEIVEWVTSRVAAGLRHARPETLTTEFGAELTIGERGLVAALAGTGGKAALKVTMQWGAAGVQAGAEPPTAEPN